jgi:hypothetical protein
MANLPTYIAYHVKDTAAGENGEKRGVWTQVGAAWPNKDGRGFNVVLDVVPLDGIRMKLSISSRCKFNGFVLLTQTLPQYLCCGLSFS